MTTAICTIVFIDIDEAHKLYSALGNQTARQSIDQFFAKLRQTINLHGGIVVKMIGEGLMCRFESANEAVKAVTLIQASSGPVDLIGHPGLRLRIGLHQGDVIEDDDDIFGDSVNVAARMRDFARPGQTIITYDTVTVLTDELRKRIRQIDLTHVKGKKEEMALFEVLWEFKEEVTRQTTHLLSKINSRGYLTLSHLDNKLVMQEEQKSILLGRGENCEFIVKTELASREHAVIEVRRGKFVLLDQGSNGTFVKTDSGREVYLRREAFVLHNRGQISLGKSFTKCADAELIYFSCVQLFDGRSESKEN
jgi:adenylate cyclase